MSRTPPHSLLGRMVTTALVSVVLSCSDTTPTGPRTTLNQARSIWNSQNITDYSFVITRACVCEPTRTVRVTVTANQVSSRVIEATGEPLDPSLNERFPAVPGLFDLLEEAFDTGADAVLFTADNATGVPTSIAIDYMNTQIEDNLNLTMLSFTRGTPAPLRANR